MMITVTMYRNKKWHLTKPTVKYKLTLSVQPVDSHFVLSFSIYTYKSKSTVGLERPVKESRLIYTHLSRLLYEKIVNIDITGVITM